MSGSDKICETFVISGSIHKKPLFLDVVKIGGTGIKLKFPEFNQERVSKFIVYYDKINLPTDYEIECYMDNNVQNTNPSLLIEYMKKYIVDNFNPKLIVPIWIVYFKLENYIITSDITYYGENNYKNSTHIGFAFVPNNIDIEAMENNVNSSIEDIIEDDICDYFGNLPINEEYMFEVYEKVENEKIIIKEKYGIFGNYKTKLIDFIYSNKLFIPKHNI